MSGVKALKKFRSHLSRYEQTEILKYDAVYYYGQRAKGHKIEAPQLSDVRERPRSEASRGREKPATLPKITQKHYDDSEGNYLGIKGDHIGYRYEIMSLLGTGSFGNVF